MKSLTQKKLEEAIVGRNLILAQIADNLSYKETLKQKKFDDNNEKKIILPRYKIRIAGQHGKDIPTAALPWAYAKYLTSGLRGESIGNPVYPKGTWVYVEYDPDSSLYYIDRISPNTLCDPPSDENGFSKGGKDDDLVPETLISPDGNSLAPCGGVYNNIVPSLEDEKEDSPSEDAPLLLPSFCDATKTAAMGEGIQNDIEKTIKMSERLKGITGALDQVQTSILDAQKSNQEVISSFNDTIATYQKSLAQASKDISKWLANLLIQIKAKWLRKAAAKNNAVRAVSFNSQSAGLGDKLDFAINQLACIINKIISRLGGLVYKALVGILGKIVNATSCLVENFIGNFLGQLLGQVAALISDVFKSIGSALGAAGSLLGSASDLISSIGDILDDILSIFDCEFKTCVGPDNKVIRYSIIDGAEPKTTVIDFNKVFNKAKKVAEDFSKVTEIPDNVGDYEFNFDIQREIDEIFDQCDPGPIFCGVPDVVFWGGKGSGAQGNPVISVTGDLLGIDIRLPGNYEETPLISFEDKCGNGRGGIGEVFIGDVTETVGELDDDDDDDGTDGTITDEDDPNYPGDGGQGTTAGIGITYQVTVNAVAAGNRFFIDDKQQKTLTFERGNTYILNQEHISNNGHPLRFSETKDGTWGGGSEYTMGVTIDGIPGLGESPTDIAYSRMVVNNNTPDRLYYYCENHSKMGGVINVITSTMVGGDISDTSKSPQRGRDATVEISDVDSNGGVTALKNLVGGTGYNGCMANVVTKGGSGTRFTVEIVSVDNGSIRLVSINNKGSNYQIGDIVTITARLTQSLLPVTSIGVTKVLIKESGYGYLRGPDGSKGGMGRTWANRCQTIVRRKNLDWDAPYSEGDIINLYLGDCVELPGKSKICIDENFDVTKLPGSLVTGTATYTPQDMSNFPLSTPKKGSALDFTISSRDLVWSKAEWPFDSKGGYGIVRRDGRNPDLSISDENIIGGLTFNRNLIAQWDFYVDGELIQSFKQLSNAASPEFRDEEKGIVYKVGSKFTPPVEIDPIATQAPWVPASFNLPIGVVGLWSPFLITYGIFPARDTNQENFVDYDPISDTFLTQIKGATWRVNTFYAGEYTFELQADNQAAIYWDGVLLGETPPYSSHNIDTLFSMSVTDVKPQTHEIKVTIQNMPHDIEKEPEKKETTHLWDYNPAAVAWVLRDPNGTIIKSSLDPFDVKDKITYDFDTYYHIDLYNVNKDSDLGDTWFGCEKDYNYAKLLGFTDCDIRHFLEENPDINLDQCMKDKLDDENWGNCKGDLTVSITAPPCPPDPCLPEGTYPVIACLDEIIVENPGFGFDCCKDTVSIVPDNGAKAEIEECRDGKILRIRVIDCGSGFTELPQIFINTETGYNSVLKPILKFHGPEEMDVPKGTSVIQVVDCVGKFN